MTESEQQKLECAIARGDNPLWQAAIAKYQIPDVAPALLALQSANEDVLWLLYLSWCDDQKQAAMPQPDKGYLWWRETMIVPQRQLRMRYPSSWPQRQALLDAELQLEQVGVALIYQSHLDWITNHHPSDSSNIELHVYSNLMRYKQHQINQRPASSRSDYEDLWHSLEAVLTSS